MVAQLNTQFAPRRRLTLRRPLSEIEEIDRELAFELLIINSPMHHGVGEDYVGSREAELLPRQLRERFEKLPRKPAEDTKNDYTPPPSLPLRIYAGQACAERALLLSGITPGALRERFPGAFVRAILCSSTDTELLAMGRIGIDPGPHDHDIAEIRSWMAGKLGSVSERVTIKQRDRCCKRSCGGCLSGRGQQDVEMKKRWLPPQTRG